MARNSFDININLKGFPQAQAHISKTKEGMDRMRVSTSGLKRSVGALRNNMLLYAFTIGAITRVTNSLIATYRKQVEAERLLDNNLKNVIGTTDLQIQNLKELASGYQQVTTFGDEQIISAQSLLATFQLTSDTIAQLTPRVLDMSAAMGTDLRSSALLLGKAFVGETSRLKQVGIVIDTVGLKLAKAKSPIEEAAFLLKTLDDNFGGAAQALRDTPLGELDGLNMGLGDLKEKLGETAIPLETFITQLQLGAIESLTSWAFFFTEWSKLSKGNILDVLKISEAFANANKRVVELTKGSAKSLDEFGTASTNSSNATVLAKAKETEAINKSIVSLVKELNGLKSKQSALNGSNLETQRSIILGRNLSKEEKTIITQIEETTNAIEKRTELESNFNGMLDKSNEFQMDRIRLLMAEVNAEGESLGSKKEIKIVLDALKLAYDELDPVLQNQKILEAEAEEARIQSIETLRQEEISIRSKIAEMDGANIATIKAIELDRELLPAEQALVDEIQKATDALNKRTKEQNDQITLQSEFESVLKATKEGEIAHIQAIIAKIETSNLLVATDKERILVTEELKQKIEDLESGGSLKKSVDNSRAFAQGIIMAAGAMKSLTDESTSTEQKLSTLLSTLGSVLMMTPGGQIPGAFLTAGSMFVGHTGGLIKDSGIQRFATGGMVQGQDNVPIMAQAGEFIMQRSAVNNIGVDNLAEMNSGSGGGGGVTINISAPLVDEHVIDVLIPAINNAVGTGKSNLISTGLKGLTGF